ncbi:hypothetical protein HGP14_34950 [Rhizobium sp. P32RR-XVIII]|uniref:hypothetical protein n=1 Tax=Rhizobium sp. P32RR-XVIII TaxID=2726738 RepID=UPI0014577C6E|nr:hypothetical protein [Rhizobium sp. P32RR-XVIII]NLS08368.1 hypothetical protein [Rhizobium sp. P32RR-XVIII]
MTGSFPTKRPASGYNVGFMYEQFEDQLSKVCWIAGATDAGKTSIALALARKHRLPVYHYDAHDLRHHQRLAEREPRYAAFLRQTLDERWVRPTPGDLAARAWQSFEDRFPLVLEDLTTLALPNGMPVIAEGYGLTPRLVSPLLGDPSQFVCLLPSVEFKDASMQKRGKGQFGGDVSDPQRASDNLRRRDQIIADRLRVEAQTLGRDIIEADGSKLIDELAVAIGLRFRLQDDNGSRTRAAAPGLATLHLRREVGQPD